MGVLLAAGAILATSLVAALVFTPAVRALAVRVGAVARPSPGRWHKRPTALLGGVAIVLATAAGLAAATFLLGNPWAVRSEAALTRPALGLALSAAFMCVVGLFDDVRPLRPQAKFLVQLLAGLGLLTLGAVFPVTPWHAANVVATLFWFVALTNAFNLLDGLDGVAAGVGAIASFFLGLTFARRGAWVHAAAAWSLAGAAVGFVRYNFHPASIFMGDAGSMFLGSALAGLVVTAPSAASASFVSVLFVPLAIVAVPLLDTTLVTVTRLLAGRPVSQGGLDHTTYRLIALGLSESQVALLLYAFAAAGGVVALLLARLDRGLGLSLGAAFLVAMSLAAASIGRIQIGPPDRIRALKPATVLVRNLFYKRRLAEILLDVVLVTLSYYGGYRLRFDGALPPAYAEAFQTTVGIVIGANIVAFWAFGVYRGAWQYAGVLDVYRVLGAVGLAGVAVLVYGEWRVPALAQSHGIVYGAALLTTGLVLASRLSFRSLETLRDWVLRRGERAVIYGAADGGELTLRHLVSSPELELWPVCFVDDDERTHGAEIHGVPIVGGLESLAPAVARYNIKKIVIGTRKSSPEAVAAVRSLAERLGLEIGEVRLAVIWSPKAGRRGGDAGRRDLRDVWDARAAP